MAELNDDTLKTVLRARLIEELQNPEASAAWATAAVSFLQKSDAFAVGGSGDELAEMKRLLRENKGSRPGGNRFKDNKKVIPMTQATG